MLADSNARLAAARRLTSPKGRSAAGRFLAEGVPAVREALAAGVVESLFMTEAARGAHPELDARAPDLISERSAAQLSETVHPQGVIAVCRCVDVPLDALLAESPRLVAGLVKANDPGNAGTILRTADAAGASAVVLTAGSVDVYNGKTVRASAGSLFHLPVGVDVPSPMLVNAARAAGLQILAASGAGSTDLDELSDSGRLATPTLWLFGNEARGLDEAVLAAADETVRVPIYGRAESLNLAAAAAICLYSSARAQNR